MEISDSIQFMHDHACWSTLLDFACGRSRDLCEDIDINALQCTAPCRYWNACWLHEIDAIQLKLYKHGFANKTVHSWQIH